MNYGPFLLAEKKRIPHQTHGDALTSIPNGEARVWVYMDVCKSTLSCPLLAGRWAWMQRDSGDGGGGGKTKKTRTKHQKGLSVGGGSAASLTV
ncbi:hypothetical protein ElyMa_004253700 [Elysia marginata]|uniref:Uncharacterized protein n=1 Tax=Elysia marginata TaxID=1093978 RepID=A0AAV4GUU6_9GAST|nr:hypothetical protein ElyMa_004253700 [Elysia marginata]